MRPVAIAGAGLAGVLALSACGSATQNSTAPPHPNGTGQSAAPHPSPTSTSAALNPKQIKQKYGTYPLPISVQDISKYHVTNRQLKQIKKARKLAKTPHARYIRHRESRDQYRNRSGQYTGAWQFDTQTWRSYGGRQFAPVAWKAPRWAQDLVMWKAHRARGWQPWGG